MAMCSGCIGSLVLPGQMPGCAVGGVLIIPEIGYNAFFFFIECVCRRIMRFCVGFQGSLLSVHSLQPSQPFVRVMLSAFVPGHFLVVAR